MMNFSGIQSGDKNEYAKGDFALHRISKKI